MRTTLTIDDDVLKAARAVAQLTNRSIGEVISGLARRALNPPVAQSERNGIPLLPMRKAGTIVTTEMVNALRDDGP